MIEIYTDGSSKGNPGLGGYGSILMHGDRIKEISGAFKHTTNNRMELMGVIEALKCLKKEGLDITIYSDSKYVVDGIEKGWYKGWIKKDWKDVKNPDLWKPLIELYNKHNIKFVWVKGHSSNKWNNRCDELATSAYLNGNINEDKGYIR